MEREWLSERLEAGASYEAIGREVGKSPSTVAYWAQTHGLESRHARHHAARGEIDPVLLRELVATGASVRELAEVLERSATTVRYWLKRHGLRTQPSGPGSAAVQATQLGLKEAVLYCPTHGITRHVRRDRGFRCARCRSTHVTARRRRMKARLVEDAGGACVLCGYDRCIAALHFHHVDPTTKSFAIGVTATTLSLGAARAEASKCVLLCANCHGEVENGVADLSPIIGSARSRMRSTNIGRG